MFLTRFWSLVVCCRAIEGEGAVAICANGRGNRKGTKLVLNSDDWLSWINKITSEFAYPLVIQTAPTICFSNSKLEIKLIWNRIRTKLGFACETHQAFMFPPFCTSDAECIWCIIVNKPNLDHFNVFWSLHFQSLTLFSLQMGSYFGYAVATTDINSDGWVVALYVVCFSHHPSTLPCSVPSWLVNSLPESRLEATTNPLQASLCLSLN